MAKSVLSSVITTALMVVVAMASISAFAWFGVLLIKHVTAAVVQMLGGA